LQPKLLSGKLPSFDVTFSHEHRAYVRKLLRWSIYMRMSAGFLALPEAFHIPENLISAYFDSPSIGFGVIDSKRRYIAINHALAKMNGIPAERHLGWTLRDVLGNVADTIEPHFHYTVSSGNPTSFELSGHLPNRSDLGHWLVHYVPIKDANMVTRVGAAILETAATQPVHALAEKRQTGDGKSSCQLGAILSAKLSGRVALYSGYWRKQPGSPRPMLPY
jgi:PAS domain-containing protein